jgi:tetrahydromethanopterin S-methyltransferase subunit B
MSDYAPEQQLRLLEEYNARLERGIAPTQREAEAMERLADSTGEAKKRINQLNQEFDKLGKGLQKWTLSTYDGQQGMTAMAGAVEGAAAVVGLMTALIPGFGLLKLAIGGLTALAVAYIKKTSEQADALFETYQQLNKNGMATAGGMTEVYKNMQSLGYGVEDLKKMQALLRDNSETLANFGGTAATGMQTFVNAAGEIERSNIGQTFQRMGKTPDEINRGVAMFIRGQQELGISNRKTYENLAERAANYVMELDKLQKLTGQDPESIQKKLDEAYAEQAFNQLQYELEERYRSTGDLQAKAALERNRKLAAMLPGEIRTEFIRGVAGDLTALAKTQAVAPGAVALIQSQNYTAEQYIDTVNEGIRNVRKSYGTLFKYNSTNDWLFAVKDMSEIESRYADQSAEQQEDQAKKEQKNQKENLDPNTKAMVDLRISQQNTRDALQNFVNVGIKPAITAMEAIQEAGTDVFKKLPGARSDRQDMGGGPPGDLGAKGGVARTAEELKKMGLILNSGDVQGNSRLLDERLIKLAKMVQTQVPGFRVFTSFNDNFHAEKYSWSEHAKGRAIDFTLDHRPSEEEGQKIVRQLKNMGASYVIDEYNHPSKGATGGHIHASVSAARGFEGIITGPVSGYRPDIVMHGKEKLIITPQKQIPEQTGSRGYDPGLMTLRANKLDSLIEAFRKKHDIVPLIDKLEKLEQLAVVMKRQLDISTNILQASR